MLPQSMFPVVRDPECACPPRIVSYVGGTENDGDILIYDETTNTWVVGAPAAGGGVTVLANVSNNNTVSIMSGTPILITGMTATVATTAGKSQLVIFDSDVYLGAVGSATDSQSLDYYIFIDGNLIVGKQHDNRDTDWTTVGIGISHLVQGLAAGNHTFEILANSENGSRTAYVNTAGDSTTAIRMFILEF